MFIPAYIYNYPSFMGFSFHKMPTEIGWKYYISWEDALWDLLKAKNVPQNSVVLMPSYHCLDVMNNIDNHGYKCLTYEVDRNFVITPEKLLLQVKETNAKIIVIFHTQGINNPLMSDTSWIKELPEGVIVIEDAVHHLIKPQEVKIINDNHFLMDSQRKVTPLTGSFIYGTKKAMDYPKETWNAAFGYEMKAVLLHLAYQFLWWLGYSVKSKKVIEVSEKVLKVHDDLIGDSKLSGHNFVLFRWLYQFINFDKVYRIKTAQVKVYQERLHHIFKRNKAFFLPHFEENNAAQLRNFPVGLHIKYANEVLHFLRENGLLLQFLLNDCEWSQKQKLITLPLGPHISKKNIDDVCSLIEKYDRYFPHKR